MVGYQDRGQEKKGWNGVNPPRLKDPDEEASGAGGEKEKEGLMLAVLLCWLPPPRVSG